MLELNTYDRDTVGDRAFGVAAARRRHHHVAITPHLQETAEDITLQPLI